MSTYTKIIYHIVFGTKSRERVLIEENCYKLYKYITGILKNKNSHLYRIGGVENHIHILTSLHPTENLSGFIKDIKVSSSGMIKKNKLFPFFEHWQIGYGAFSVSSQDKERVINYIKNQKEHHKVKTYRQELKELLIENDIEFEEKYLL